MLQRCRKPSGPRRSVQTKSNQRNTLDEVNRLGAAGPSAAWASASGVAGAWTYSHSIVLGGFELMS
jgi:hypothetical protein